jgi:hypothetical protein
VSRSNRISGVFVGLGLSLALLPLLVCAEAIKPDSHIAIFNGSDLSNWTVDVPSADSNADIAPSFIVRDGLLVSLGEPRGHLITKTAYRDYLLDIEYRFPGEPGNAGVLIHTSTPRALYNMFPRSIEVQMQHGDAGDFWCIEEDILVDYMTQRRPRKEGQAWGGRQGDARRILNLTDSSERPLGEWNSLQIEARSDTIKVWLNGDLVNDGYGASTSEGQIALQAEGAEVEIRTLSLAPL